MFADIGAKTLQPDPHCRANSDFSAVTKRNTLTLWTGPAVKEVVVEGNDSTYHVEDEKPRV